MEPICIHCEKPFVARRQVKTQRHCSQPACQKARKKKWQHQKLRTDPDYRRNQAAAQATWRKQHQEYWKKYRQRHPEYTARNRLRQQERNRRRRMPESEITQGTIAKMDASKAANAGNSLKNKLFGIFRLAPVAMDGQIAKMDACVVEIREITSTS